MVKDLTTGNMTAAGQVEKAPKQNRLIILF